MKQKRGLGNARFSNPRSVSVIVVFVVAASTHAASSRLYDFLISVSVLPIIKAQRACPMSTKTPFGGA